MSKSFYAVSYRYGKNARCADTGEKIFILHSFESRADRDEWVSDCTVAFESQSGWREAVSYAEIRRYIRRGFYYAGKSRGNGVVIPSAEEDSTRLSAVPVHT